MNKEITSPDKVSDINTRRALIGLSAGTDINHSSITDQSVRRIVIALDQRNKGSNVSIPNPSHVKDLDTRRILQQLI